MSESYQKGRTGGVEGTYGDKRKGVAEKTAIDNDASELPGKASSMYSKAVKNGGGTDTGGDPALRQR